MKKHLIAAVLGGIILFIWQTLSWTVIPIHNNSTKYTKYQDTLLNLLNINLKEEGLYMIPNLDLSKNPTGEEYESFSKANTGKPFATINYVKENPGMDPFVFLKGIIINIISCFIVVLLLNSMNLKDKNLLDILKTTMLFPILIIFQATLTDTNWWNTPFHFYIGTIVDLLSGWLLVGLWFGFFLRK